MRKLLLFMLCSFLTAAQLMAQNRTISGKVTDDKGNPLPQASVQVKGTDIGTTTTTDGKFSLSVPSNSRTLVVSSVGMETREVSIGNQNTVSVGLTATSAAMDEVI